MANLPPLSLYIHIPWCVQKCPYCDFNSHALKGEVPHDDYVAHLLADLDVDVPYAQGREVKTIFIGGGTPSLLSGPAMQTLLDGVRARLTLAADAEMGERMAILVFQGGVSKEAFSPAGHAAKPR